MIVYIATCRDLERFFPSSAEPLFTHDDQALVMGLRKKGFQVKPFLWDEDSLGIIKKKDVIIIRSTWNYMDSDESIVSYECWLNEIERRKLRALNSPALMKWNFNKSYLKSFQDIAPILVTSWLDSVPNAVEWFRERGSFVLKPQRGAAAKHVYRVRNLVEAEKLAVLCQRMDPYLLKSGWMLQPYVEGVEIYGELSLVYFQESYSHSVLKIPAKGDWRVQDELGGSVLSVVPSQKAIEIGNAVIAALPQKADYARVDLMRKAEDEYLLGEVELIEPELFFLERTLTGNRVNKSAIERFVSSIGCGIDLKS
ncbi:MAG: RimK family alpha-L-glutamate ligase [Oligoflexales bacterium]